MSGRWVEQFPCKTAGNGFTPAGYINAYAKQHAARIVSISVFENEDTRQNHPAGYSSFTEQCFMVLFESNTP